MKCKYCSSSDIRTYNRKNKHGERITVQQPICYDCWYKKTKKIPLYFTPSFITFLHTTFDWSIEVIAEKHKLTVEKVYDYFKYYDIPEIKRCKECGTKENLVLKNNNNQYTTGRSNKTYANICKTCISKKQSEQIKKAKSKQTEKDKLRAKQKYLAHYKKDPNKKKKEAKKCSNTWKNKSEEEIVAFRQKVSEGRKNGKSPHNSNGGVGIIATKLFSTLAEMILYFQISYDEFCYAHPRLGKRVNLEKIVNTYGKTKVRFLDCYIKIGEREINFEFDETLHKRQKEEDLIREQEIKAVKPDMEIYRIKEEDYLSSPMLVLVDLLNIIYKQPPIFFDYPALSE